MRIGMYNPYLGGIGGGERYTLTLASHWSKKHDVSVFWNDPRVLRNFEKQFGLDLKKVKVFPNVFGSPIWYPFKLLVTRFFDVLFVLSDGSAPNTNARYNILHFQLPLPHVAIPPEKLQKYHAIVCNSHFTKKFLDPAVSKDALVIYPPITPIPQNPAIPKENIILSVGRFSPVHTMKKHEVMIQAFGRVTKNIPGWKLVLVGGLLKQDEYYLKNLRKMSQEYPVTIMHNITRSQLESLYQRASIYWHAAGFGETDPMYMEHFGISTLEAMSAGCVPVVFGGGGQTEIVQDGQNGFVWKSIDELVQKTIITSKEKQLAQMLRDASIASVQLFNEYSFNDSFDRLLKKLVGQKGSKVLSL